MVCCLLPSLLRGLQRQEARTSGITGRGEPGAPLDQGVVARNEIICDVMRMACNLRIIPPKARVGKGGTCCLEAVVLEGCL